MAVSGLLGQQNILRLEVRYRPDQEIYASSPARVELEIVNCRRWLPAFLLQLKMGEGECLVPVLPAGQKSQQRLSLSYDQRGYQALPDIWISSRFPINFFVRSRRLQVAQQVLVFPQPLTATVPTGAANSRQQPRASLPQPGIDGELRSIDNYRDGDPLKSIHWKLSARQDDYKVKRLQRLGAPAQLIDLAQLPGGLEERLSRCTFLINQLCRQQQAVGLQLGQERLPPALGGRHRHKLLTRLALYDQG